MAIDRSSALLAVVLFGLIIFGTCSARAQPQVDPRPVGSPPASQVLTVQGVQGMWFPMEAARRLLGDVEELAALKVENRLLIQKLALREETVALLTQNLAWTEEQSQHWREALGAALRRADHKPGFFERPTVNFFLGFVSAGAFSLGLLYGLNHVGG